MFVGLDAFDPQSPRKKLSERGVGEVQVSERACWVSDLV